MNKLLMVLAILGSAAFSVKMVDAQTEATLDLPVPSAGFEPFSFVNFESPHVSPIDLTPDRSTLVAVNTADNSVMVFDLASGSPRLTDTIPVGLDPVSVRARTNSEVWVVNHISDSISIVDIDRGLVTRTLATEDEPADVVFAGTPTRAFVSASQVNRLNVYDLSDLDAPPATVPILGEDPRMLAVSPDGNTVYAAVFESGNGTTTVRGETIAGKMSNVVGRNDTPYGGNPLPPNDGDQYDPPLNPDLPINIRSMIVRKDDNGRWMDDNNGDWTRWVSGDLAAASDRVTGWDLPDRDVAAVNASTLDVTYQTRLMNIVMALDVNPVTGELLAVGTEATNEIRWEPNLQATFVRVQMARFTPGGTATIEDLNPHLDYSVRSVPQSERDRSIGDPRGVAFTADGQSAYVTGMGSNNVVVLDGNGDRLARIEVGEGPTGVVINDGANRAYVMNKFDGSISVLDTSTRAEIDRVAFFDPTPQAIKDGRPLLYDTHASSGLGQVACASCHVDARTDRLAWDLGNPSADQTTRSRSTDGQVFTFSPLKGPMKTQTFQDIIGVPAMHHIGDKDDLFGFADSFTKLQGADQEPDENEMAQFEAMLGTVHYPPNPNRNIDNSLSTEVEIQGPNGEVYAVANAVAGRNSFLTGNGTSSHCSQCHNNARTRTDIRKTGNNEFVRGMPLIPENLRGFYDRMGFFRRSADGSTSGFGYLPDGSQSSELISTFQNFPLDSQSGLHVHAYMLSIDGPDSGLPGLALDSHAGVGQQVTVTSPEGGARLLELVSIANSNNIGLVANGVYRGQSRGFMYTGEASFQSDRLAERVELSDLVAGADAATPMTFTLVPVGSQYRIGIDGDEDGVLDGDERADGADPQNPTDGGWVDCATEGQNCQFDGVANVRFGGDGQFVQGVFRDGVSCSTAAFGDNLVGGTRGCQIGASAADNSTDSQCRTISFLRSPIRRFGGQDNGDYEVLGLGDGLRVFSNGWKAIDFDYPLTANTVLEFDFQASVQGEEHAVGFSDALSGAAGGRRFKLYGTQATSGDAIQDFNTYPGDGSVQRVMIPVGQFFQGSFDYLVLTADDDARSAGESIFSNMRIYEAGRSGDCDSDDPGVVGAELGGTVVNNPDGAPRPGVAVDLFAQRADGSRGQFLDFTVTDAEGRYRFSELDPGCYTVTFIAPTGERFANGQSWLNSGVCVEAGDTRDDLGAALGQPLEEQDGLLVGRVRFADDTPTPDVLAVLYRANADGTRGQYLNFATTNAEGTYSFSVDPGCYLIDLQAPFGSLLSGREWLRVGGCVEAGQTTSGLGGVVSGVEELTAAIGGTVSNSDAVGVENVQVDLFQTAADGSRGSFLDSTTTRANGSFSFDVEPACHTLTYVAPLGERFVAGSPWFNRTFCPDDGEEITNADAVLGDAL